VQAVITVKHEEDDVEESGGPPQPAAETNVVKRRNEETQGNVEQSRRRLLNRRGTALVSDNEENGSEEEYGIEGGTYKLRKTSKVNYREEDDDEEEDELMMGAEVNSCFPTCRLESQPASRFLKENHDVAYPIDPSRQQAAVAPPSRKRRKYTLR
jgi:hypothetical protein